MNNYKYISTTLPYINSTPHIGHCFEFVLGDVIAEYHRLNGGVFFNVGIDEHGQKVYQKSIDENYLNTQEYCDAFATKWKEFCSLLKINYDNFYRTTDFKHKENVLRFYNEIEKYVFTKNYEGKYCVGCESFITEKEIIDDKCPIHKTDIIHTKETNKFFDLSKHHSG
jgi:methionyl-tRNA synthetase